MTRTILRRLTAPARWYWQLNMRIWDAFANGLADMHPVWRMIVVTLASFAFIAELLAIVL